MGRQICKSGLPRGESVMLNIGKLKYYLSTFYMPQIFLLRSCLVKQADRQLLF